MTGYAGCFGAGLVAEKKSKALLERFPSFLVRNAILQGKEDENEKAMSLLKESDDDYGMIGMVVVSDGGVFKGLWNLGETCDVGFSVDLKEIPIRQETVEVCNFFDINPYPYQQEILDSNESCNDPWKFIRSDPAIDNRTLNLQPVISQHPRNNASSH